MDKVLKKKWLSELRSGKYKQGFATLLQYNGNMCCLGVYAKCVLGKNIKPAVRGALTAKERAELGLSQKHMEKLIEFNDAKRWSFKRIAAYIDRYL